MEVKFKKGQSVRITKRNGEIIDGLDCNMCSGGCDKGALIIFSGS